MLKDFVSQSAKGFSFLPELSGAQGEPRADCAGVQFSQGTRSRAEMEEGKGILRNVSSDPTWIIKGCDFSRRLEINSKHLHLGI